jgi:hypothetical protein
MSDGYPKRLDVDGIQNVFLEALGARVISHSSATVKPLDLELASPLPRRIRVYLYNATHPPGGRTLGEHKIQLIVPGQGRGQRGNFEVTADRMIVLAGLEVELGVFILWDAGMYKMYVFKVKWTDFQFC